MAETNGLSAGDILALKDNDMFGGNWGGIIGLLIIAGIFGGGMFGGFGNNGLTQDYIASEFTQRDIFNTNQNVSNTAAQTQVELLKANNAEMMATLENRFNCTQNACNTQKEVLQNRYENALSIAGLNKDVLLGNQSIMSQMAQCCCDLKTAIHGEGEATRALITQNTIQDLRDQVAGYRETLSNANQTQNILNTMGSWRSNPSYPSTFPYYGYGTTIS